MSCPKIPITAHRHSLKDTGLLLTLFLITVSALSARDPLPASQSSSSTIFAHRGQQSLVENPPKEISDEGLFVYPAKGGSGFGVIVCPGGSYFWHDMQGEGHDVALWLQSHGITAFVLRYRTAGVPAFLLRYRLFLRGHQYPDAQDDLKAVLRYVRSHAADYGVRPERVGAMGFSAGGHLVMSVAENAVPDERPAFACVVYPVVTMAEDCTHKRSRRGLFGERRKRDCALRDSLSLERHVPADCPPVMLVACEDDPVVDFRNSLLLDSALTLRHVPHRFIRYATGGHGFGVQDGRECSAWRDAFLGWLNGLHL